MKDILSTIYHAVGDWLGRHVSPIEEIGQPELAALHAIRRAALKREMEKQTAMPTEARAFGCLGCSVIQAAGDFCGVCGSGALYDVALVLRRGHIRLVTPKAAEIQGRRATRRRAR